MRGQVNKSTSGTCLVIIDHEFEAVDPQDYFDNVDNVMRKFIVSNRTIKLANERARISISAVIDLRLSMTFTANGK